MAVEDLIEIKFRLDDGTDIGLNKYSTNVTVGSLKEKIIAQWPKDKENGPKSVNDVNLINAGRILENNKTLGESRVPISEVPGWAITMFVVVRPPIPGKNSDKKREKSKVRNYPPRISYMPGVMKKYYTSDGRLIIKEERVDSHEYFQAHRYNGRLTLHLPRNDAVSDDDEDSDGVMQHPNEDQSECKTFDGDDDKGKRIKHDDPTVYQTGASSSSV